jgi:hypothetical protein
VFNQIGNLLCVCNVHDVNNVLYVFILTERVCVIHDQIYEYFEQSGCTIRIQNCTFGNLFKIFDEIRVKNRWKHHYKI